ncbi:hypothetical protein ABK040_010751 [Willaertia magna]
MKNIFSKSPTPNSSSNNNNSNNSNNNNNGNNSEENFERKLSVRSIFGLNKNKNNNNHNNDENSNGSNSNTNSPSVNNSEHSGDNDVNTLEVNYGHVSTPFNVFELNQVVSSSTPSSSPMSPNFSNVISGNSPSLTKRSSLVNVLQRTLSGSSSPTNYGNKRASNSSNQFGGSSSPVDLNTNIVFNNNTNKDINSPISNTTTSTVLSLNPVLENKKDFFSKEYPIIKLIIQFAFPTIEDANKKQMGTLFNVALVCKGWNDALMNHSTNSWKNLYEDMNREWNKISIIGNTTNDSNSELVDDSAADVYDEVKKVVDTYCKKHASRKSLSALQQKKEPKQEEPLNPQDYYAVELSTLTYKEDPEDVIIWGEEEGQTVLDQASIDKLVEELTSHQNYDIHFTHTFMLTFRSFTDKESLLKKLSNRFNVPPPQNEDFNLFKREKLDKIRLRVVNSIKYWIENFFLFDFDHEFINLLNEFIEMIKKSNQQSFATLLTRTLEKVKNNEENKVQTQMKCPEVLKIKRNVFNRKKTFHIMEYTLLEVARQITLIEYNIFRKIEPKECLNQSWNKEHRVTKAPNIYKMIQWFNKLSNWVASEILKTEDNEKRVKLMEKYLELANHLKSLNNFNAIFAIISGFNCSAVHRLKKTTWDLLDEENIKLYQDLCFYTNSNKNFTNMRTALKNIRPPCVPYIGLFLTDLTFIEDGSPKYINGKINFSKCRKFAEVIRDVQTYQNTRYMLDDYKELHDQLLQIEHLTEDQMFELSLKIEPRPKKKKTNTSSNNVKQNDDNGGGDNEKNEKVDL